MKCGVKERLRRNLENERRLKRQSQEQTLCDTDREIISILCDEKKEYVLSKQILRSGTSIGANLAEAETASSRNDFQAKVYIALKECSETQYWLELLKETDYLTKEQYNSLNNDCEEIRRMLSSTTKTLKLTAENEE